MPKLLEQPETKLAGITGVPCIKAPRLLNQPKEPFDPTTAHPNGSALDAFSEKIDRASHANRYRHSQGTIVHEHPFLGLRTAKRNKEQIGLRRLNLPGDLLVIHIEQRIIRR